jgi:hypothetical protein
MEALGEVVNSGRATAFEALKCGHQVAVPVEFGQQSGVDQDGILSDGGSICGSSDRLPTDQVMVFHKNHP